jgi:hypothetical protein
MVYGAIGMVCGVWCVVHGAVVHGTLSVPHHIHAHHTPVLVRQGRVVLASAKNFVMENLDGGVGFQFGKQAANAFTCDFASPLSPFLAFAYALTFFEL